MRSRSGRPPWTPSRSHSLSGAVPSTDCSDFRTPRSGAAPTHRRREALQGTHAPRLGTDDIEAEVQRLEALGATRYDHQQSAALTSGSCATPGATSSAWVASQMVV